MADGFIWYELATNDVGKAAAFYSEVVGWDLRDSGMPGANYLIFGKNGKDVGGMMPWSTTGTAGLPPEWMGHIHTAKLDQELKAVLAEGGTVLKPAQDIPGVGRFAVVLDPQRVKHLLFEPANSAVPPRLGQMELGNVGWHELLTDDGAKAFSYYQKHYGWEKDYAHDMGPMGVYQTFRTNTPMYTGGIMSIKNCPGIPEGTQARWIFYFSVDDLDAAQKRILDAGGSITMPPMDVPGGSRVMQAVDNQGCAFALMQGPTN